jgi:hypothetical protein
VTSDREPLAKEICDAPSAAETQSSVADITVRTAPHKFVSGLSEEDTPMAKAIIKLAAFAGFALVLALAGTKPSVSITAELAKKCRAMAIKAHPTQPAGTKSNFGEEQRTYFRECVAKDGKM